MRVFLGGTCNGSTWRDELTPMLNIDYFNPVVEDWTPECMEEEIRQREECDYCLYTITSDMTGTFSIAEVVDDSNKRPKKTILCLLSKGFTEFQVKSLHQMAKMVESNGGAVVSSLEEVADLLNTK